MIINSYHFSKDTSRNVNGKLGSANFKANLKITAEEPQLQVMWGPKVVVPSRKPFRIMHPAFKNTTDILEDISYYGFKRRATFLECSLQNIKK